MEILCPPLVPAGQRREKLITYKIIRNRLGFYNLFTIGNEAVKINSIESRINFHYRNTDLLIIHDYWISLLLLYWF